MALQIYEGRYKDVTAQVLENESLKITALPEWGSKIASIVYKPFEYELLWQNPGLHFKKADYAAPYPEGEFAGFDEMFPTISRCYYEDPPWQGTEMPDHGEVWSLPWSWRVTDGLIEMEVQGVRFPYRLKKTLSLDGDRFSIGYSAENLSPHRLDFIWSAHPLFNTVEGMEFLVPDGMREIVNSYPGERLGPYGERHVFPETMLPDGKTFRLDRVPRMNDSGYQKYFFAAPVTEGWCSLKYPRSGLKVHMEYPQETVKYLGMWLNEGGFAGQYNIAPEPSTAAMDRVDFSKMWGMNSFLEPFEEKSWYLNITVSGEKV
jgi:galactose mutarotase-like enzyme